ncbi:MAG: tRNA pseudouridine(38-40) synthase TruA [Nitrospirota bacterium]
MRGKRINSNAKIPHCYKLTIEYDGELYHGWQKQPVKPTIAGTLEKALSRLTQEKITIVGSGRTDAGVHAIGQVAHFQVSRSFSPFILLRGLNALLPEDISVSSVDPVTPSFHARFGVKRKTYSYFIYNSPIRSAWKRKCAWHIRLPLDLEKMRQAAKALIGTHDFTSLCAKDNDAEDHTVTLVKVSITKNKDQIQITLIASRFLRYMVRNIAGLLVEVGQGRRAPDDISLILEGKDRRLSGKTAPPHGLFLMKVEYPVLRKAERDALPSKSAEHRD